MNYELYYRNILIGNLSISNEQLSYNTLTYSMNSIIVELGNYLIYKKAKDNIQAFNSLVKVNDSIISYLFAYYLKRCNKGILVELNDAMPKDIKLKSQLPNVEFILDIFSKGDAR